MKKPANWIGLIVTPLIFSILFFQKCEKPVYKSKPERIEVLKIRIDTVEKEVIKWKEAKTRIVYRTKFDTTATIDTVLIELAKCDTIVKIDSIIIQKQDTIIQDQRVIIDELDADNQELTKEVKRQKRKLVFTKILSGAVILGIIILLSL